MNNTSGSLERKPLKKLYRDRLLKLATFLEKLPRKKFNFNTVVTGPDIPNKTFSCGSVACAIGWCPVVFPSLAAYVTGSDGWPWTVKTMSDGRDGYVPTGMNLFGLTYDESNALFSPDCGSEIGLPSLPDTATPKQVAKNIRTFVKRLTP